MDKDHLLFCLEIADGNRALAANMVADVLAELGEPVDRAVIRKALVGLNYARETVKPSQQSLF